LLASIRPIGNVITHMEDITTPKCRMLLKKDLNDAKADIILHDGAPNVGKNWIHDAYQQSKFFSRIKFVFHVPISLSRHSRSSIIQASK
jgi:23S rRNA U2552 (ribose-2'-O)-methylase RlmE/FtsJ